MFVVLFSVLYLVFYYLQTLLFGTAWYFLILYLVSSYVAAGFICVIVLVGLMPIMKHTKHTNLFKFHFIRSAAVFASIFTMQLHIKVIGKKNIPKRDRRVVIYSNHKSFADPILIFKAMNRPVAFTPKMGVYKIPIISSYMRYIGSFPIDRNNDRATAKNLIKAINDVKDGLAMTIFPEGGIRDRDDDSMKEMKAGSYKIAIKSEADILPISINGNANIGKRAPWLPTRVKIVIHKAIPFETYKDMSTHDIANMVLEIINSEIKS